jgi:hypothetical protein
MHLQGIYHKQERRERFRMLRDKQLYVDTYMYIYIYIYIHEYNEYL